MPSEVLGGRVHKGVQRRGIEGGSRKTQEIAHKPWEIAHEPWEIAGKPWEPAPKLRSPDTEFPKVAQSDPWGDPLGVHGFCRARTICMCFTMVFAIWPEKGRAWEGGRGIG